MNKFISVVVCTYNRAGLLRSCLEPLTAQTLAREKFEVLVIDNNSTDDTSQVANEFAAKNSHFRVIAEPEQGLSHARNRGWKEAEGQFVAYIDDDARARTDWLSQMYGFVERNPDVEAFGGPFEAFFEMELPVWFPPEYGSWSLGERERPIKVGEEYINGTNMAFRKSLLQSLGGFKTSLGMTGERISYGEETRLLIDLAERGIPVYYLPQMRVSHLVADYKMSLRWLLFSSYASGRCSAETLNQQRSLGAHFCGLGVGTVKMVVQLIGSDKVPFKRKLYYALNGLCWEIGSFVGYLSPSGKHPVLRAPRFYRT